MKNLFILINFAFIFLSFAESKAVPVEVKSQSEFNSDGRTKSCVTTFTNLSNCKTFFCSVGNATLLLRPHQNNSHFFPKSCEVSGTPSWRCYAAQDFPEPPNCKEEKPKPKEVSKTVGDIEYKSKFLLEGNDGDPAQCTHTFKNKSCDHYYVCQVDNSGSYGLGVGPFEKIEINSMCNSEWKCEQRTDPQAHVRVKPDSCKKPDKKTQNEESETQCPRRSCILGFLNSVKVADQERDQFKMDSAAQGLPICLRGAGCPEISAKTVLKNTPQGSNGLADTEIIDILPKVLQSLKQKSN